jgi:hypothetical protein
MKTLRKSVTPKRKQQRRNNHNPVVFYELPIFAVLELVFDAAANHRGWRVSTRGEGEAAQFVFERIAPPRGGRNQAVHINPWFMREHFFAIKTVEQARVFFERFGPYQYDPHAQSEPMRITFHNLLRAQTFYSDALGLALQEWRHLTKKTYANQPDGDLRIFFEDLQLWSELPMTLKFEPSIQAQVITRSVSQAVQASIFLDKSKVRKFSLCRCGCKRPVKSTSGGGRKYFSKNCGNKVRQAKWRDAHPRD